MPKNVEIRVLGLKGGSNVNRRYYCIVDISREIEALRIREVIFLRTLRYPDWANKKDAILP